MNENERFFEKVKELKQELPYSSQIIDWVCNKLSVKLGYAEWKMCPTCGKPIGLEEIPSGVMK